jgi:hypothetical protein
MKIRSILSAGLTCLLAASSLPGCAGEAAPLPEVRYYAIADT